MHVLQRARKYRRKRVKRVVKWTLRRLNGFFGSHSRVGDPAVFDPRTFAFASALESRWRAIRDECRALLEAEARLPPVQAISPDNKRLGESGLWRVFLFYGFGYRSQRNCLECPQTAAALAAIPGLQNAWFSILEPGCRIPLHRGVSKGLVRAHLGLMVPRDSERCFMAIEDRRIHWQEGHCVVFDDMREHWVRNDSDETRVVLLVDVLRPLGWAAALLHRGLLVAGRRTAYVQDACRRQQAWEEQFYPSS